MHWFLLFRFKNRPLWLQHIYRFWRPWYSWAYSWTWIKVARSKLHYILFFFVSIYIFLVSDCLLGVLNNTTAMISMMALEVPLHSKRVKIEETTYALSQVFVVFDYTYCSSALLMLFKFYAGYNNRSVSRLMCFSTHFKKRWVSTWCLTLMISQNRLCYPAFWIRICFLLC